MMKDYSCGLRQALSENKTFYSYTAMLSKGYAIVKERKVYIVGRFGAKRGERATVQ
jgi:hypothetical protein